LQTEYIQVNYADAANILMLLTGSPTGSGAASAPAADPSAPAAPGVPAESGATGVLSSRGSATVDARTNIIIINESAIPDGLSCNRRCWNFYSHL
jgi:type II secretory pathway component HofQ